MSPFIFVQIWTLWTLVLLLFSIGLLIFQLQIFLKNRSCIHSNPKEQKKTQQCSYYKIVKSPKWIIAITVTHIMFWYIYRHMQRRFYVFAILHIYLHALWHLLSHGLSKYCQPILGQWFAMITMAHSRFIETSLLFFSPLAGPGYFTDQSPARQVSHIYTGLCDALVYVW